MARRVAALSIPMALEIPGSLRLLLPNGTVRTVRLEEYVAGVVSASLPAGAPLEALKAQAVAARTFAAITRRHLEHSAEVCAQRHCQLWQPNASAAARQAVEATRGIVATFNGAPIDAYYFDHCDGNTRDSAGILVEPHPYLKSVPCRCGFASLRGHGIGMCERGALVMARFGETYESILKHYYTGVVLIHAPVSRRRPLPGIAVPPEAAKPETLHPPAARALPADRDKPARRKRPSVTPRREQALPPEPLSVEPVAEPPGAMPAVEQGSVPAAYAEQAAQEQATVAASPDTALTAEQAPVSSPALPESESADASLAAEPTAAEIEAGWYPTAEEIEPSAAGELAEEALASTLELEAPVKQPAEPVVEKEPEIFLPPAPDSMPEEIPHFPPVTWTEPAAERVPEAEIAAGTRPTVLIDLLPGPRVIAGDLGRAGIIVTIRDREGNAVITVSGAARQHGPGGFEVALPEHGLYTLSFDGEQVDVRLRDETVFVTYGS